MDVEKTIYKFNRPLHNRGVEKINFTNTSIHMK